ncbi:hypothetical protein DSECCO2_332650 [anaerobic digester metagenome]
MIIKDLFSHKIHSSSVSWAEKLIDIACIFNEFDGTPYDRAQIEARFAEISPRASAVASIVERDVSKFRDEISAYPAYLGLYRVECYNGQWYIFLSHAAKRFLVSEEPNVAAFLMVQLLLFQYPNGMGTAYFSGSCNLRVQRNASSRTLEMINNSVHLSPLRLICRAIEADSILRDVSFFDAIVSFEEIYALANSSDIFIKALPDLDATCRVLSDYRAGLVELPDHFERRFHLLNHTNFLKSDRSGIRIRETFGPNDQSAILKKFLAINSFESHFDGFDGISNHHELERSISDCSWGKYFDGVKSIDAATFSVLTEEPLDIFPEINEFSTTDKSAEIFKARDTYPFRRLIFDPVPSSERDRKRTIYADPEVTKIKRQRANLTHKIILEKLHNYLDLRGAVSFENEHVDLFSLFPSDKKFLFEVKSVTDDNLLSQVRKGLSQLYEYRYRYQGDIGYDVNLCLVFPNEPRSVSWVEEYLCEDREILVMWFEEDELCCSKYCLCPDDVFSSVVAEV